MPRAFLIGPKLLDLPFAPTGVEVGFGNSSIGRAWIVPLLTGLLERKPLPVPFDADGVEEDNSSVARP